MASSSLKLREREELKQILQKQIEDEERKVLPAFQALVRQAHAHYKVTLDELMASTNGQIIHRLQIPPIIVTHSSQMIADHDGNSYILASPSAIKGLLTTSLQTVTMGLEDLYVHGEMMLSGEELKKLRVSKLRRAAADERLRVEYHRLVTKLALVEAQLMGLQKKDWKNGEKRTNHVNQMPTDVTALHKDPKQAVIDHEAHLLYLLRNQFNYMFFGFSVILTLDSPSMKTIRQDHHATCAMYTLHCKFEALPDKIVPAQHAKLIKELTTAVEKLRQQYKKARSIALKSLEEDLAAPNMDDQEYPANKELLQSTVGGLKLAEFTNKMFDCRVSWADEEVKTYRKLIEQMGQRSWTEALLEMTVKNSELRKETLLQDLTKLEMERCEERGCSCIDDENTANDILPGSGTEHRSKDDRAKVKELLAGREPWKEKMDELEKMLKEQKFGFM